MSRGLGPDARALVTRVRRSDGPSAHDRARLRAQLEPIWASQRERTGEAAEAAAARGLRRGLLKLSLSISTLVLIALGFWHAEPSKLHAPVPRDQLVASATATPRADPTAAAATLHGALAATPTAVAETAVRHSEHTPGPKATSPSVESTLPRSAPRARTETSALHDSAVRGIAARSLAAARGADANAAELLDSRPHSLAPDPKSRSSVAAADARRSGSVRGAPVMDAPAPTAGSLDTAAPTDSAAYARRSISRSSAGARPRATSRVIASPTSPSAGAAGGHSDADAAPTLRGDGFVPQPIDDELAWLGAAQEALRKRQPARALQLVQEHAFRYPRGALAPERSAVQALALCGLQRKQAARAVLGELERRTPTSPLVERVRLGCGL